MEVLNNLLRALLAGDAVLWSLLVAMVLIVWVVVDATIMSRGMPSKHSYDDDLLHDQSGFVRSEDDSTDWSSSFGGAWGHGTNSDGTSRM